MTKEDIKRKAMETWESFKDVLRRAHRWILDNPLYSIGFATVLMRIVGGIYGAHRQVKTEYDEKERRLRRYDRKSGQYVYLTRELTGEEVLYVENELKKDRYLAEIYEDLGVLRY